MCFVGCAGVWVVLIIYPRQLPTCRYSRFCNFETIVLDSCSFVGSGSSLSNLRSTSPQRLEGHFQLFSILLSSGEEYALEHCKIHEKQ